ncbi:MFS transporter [Microlunatus speluncae]|uniref:MFS transporter n=1 Tax=Microlunatus speluncae TaxID=2594267 RepID=UPI0012667C07|nr:MFS transporter [Microlunatus speluncae]
MLDQAMAPLRNRRFTVVLSGEGLSMIGDAAFGVALAWLVLQQTGSVAALASVLLVQAIPGGLLSLFGGAITDRVSPRTVMLWSHVVRGLAVGAVAIMAWTGSLQLWQLYAFAVITGVAGAFFGPASESVLPFLLPAEQLPRGNALQGAVEQTVTIAGPLLGGLLTAGLGPAVAIGLNALTFFIAAMTVRAAPRSEATHQESMSASVVLKEIGEGLQLARRSHEVRIVLLIVGASALSYSGLFAVGLPALAQSFSTNAVALGTLISAWGVGQLLGTISAAITGLPRRWGLLIIGMTIVEATAFALLGVSPNIFVASAILVVVGFGVAYSSDVALPTFIQTRTPRQFLGRISSLIGLPRVVLGPVSIALLGGVLTHSVGWGFAIAAIPMLLVGIRLALDPEARNLRTDPPPVNDEAEA